MRPTQNILATRFLDRSPRAFARAGTAPLVLRAFSSLILAAAVLFSHACKEHPSGPGTEAGVDASAPDSAPRDAAPDASAPDAWVRPDARAFDFCDQPIFKMPFDGTEGYLVEQEIEGTSIYYAYRAFGSPGFIYRFDLERCEELQLTLDGSAGAFGVGNGIIVYQRLGEVPLCCDLDVLHTSDLSIEPLKHGPACEWKPRTNGRHVAYFSQPDNQSQGEFRLLDLSLGTDILLPYRGIRTPTNLSDRYLVFSAYPLLPGTEGTDVFVHDLRTGDTTSIEASHELCQDWVFVWEDYLAWSGSTGCTSAPYHLMVHNLET
ncbi:MAG: hypothetical protein RBU30_20300, partial [Polyangia bacterium]|nr:hypothetical protein [Polyangia bacterium]